MWRKEDGGPPGWQAQNGTTVVMELDERQVMEIALVENRRGNLNPIEEAGPISLQRNSG